MIRVISFIISLIVALSISTSVEASDGTVVLRPDSNSILINGGRAPARRTAVYLTVTGHAMECPSMFVGCALILLSKDEVVYEQVITGKTIRIPDSLHGTFEIQIDYGNCVYSGVIDL